MRKILSLLFSVGIGVSLSTSHTDAFQEQTHRNMTDQAITYMIEKGGFAPSCPTYPMITEGAVAEDIPDTRSFFHFSPKMNSLYASADCDATAWAFEPKPCTAKIPVLRNTLSNAFNWPNALAGAGTDAGWVAMGHLLHLLQDMAVPAHTRNDPHPLPLSEPLEDKAEKLSLTLPDGQPLPGAEPLRLFEQLRDHTKSRHFSADTCFHPDLPGPSAAYEDNNYFYDAEGRRIAHKGRSYRWYGDKQNCTINTTIAQDQYDELGPLAVRYAASLIKYYSDQTNTSPCPPPTGWVKKFGGPDRDVGFSFQQTDDKGYIITGQTVNRVTGRWGIYLIKTDVNGKLQWENAYGGTNLEQGYSVQQTPDKGYIVAGVTHSYNATGRPELCLLKTDATGALLWKKAYRSGSGATGLSVRLTPDDGYIVSGWSEGDGNISYAYIIKTDSNGNLLWERTFGSEAVAFEIKPTSDGGYITAGTNGGLIYLIKMDRKGNLKWEKTYGRENWNEGFSVEQTSDGGYIVLGISFSSETSNDAYLIKTDAGGNSLWEKAYGGQEHDKGRSVIQTSDGGYIFTGSTNSPVTSQSKVYLVKTDFYGNAIWSRAHAIGYNAWGQAVQQTHDGGYAITGHTSRNPDNLNNLDVFLMKTDQNGNL